MVSGLNFLSDNYSIICPGTLLWFMVSFNFISSCRANRFNKTELKTHRSFAGGRALLQDAAGQLCGSGQCCSWETWTRLLDIPWGTVQKRKSIACLRSHTLTKAGATAAGSRQKPLM